MRIGDKCWMIVPNNNNLFQPESVVVMSRLGHNFEVKFNIHSGLVCNDWECDRRDIFDTRKQAVTECKKRNNKRKNALCY